MPKRAVSFADDIETRTFKRERHELAEDFDLPMDDPRQAPATEEEEDMKKKKHTLDSDEEDEDDHKQLDMKKVEGQEDSTIDFDGSIKITAFNMKEDMEEGHFDDTGNFIFNKKEKDIQDAWLDGIDWSTVKKKAGEQWEGEDHKEKEEEAAPAMDDIRKKEIFQRLLEVLKPNQSVAKALTDIKKRKKGWAAKKAGKTVEEMSGQKETDELGGLADELISAGFMDAYEWHREKIEHDLNRMNKVAIDDVDMFSDEPTSNSAPTVATVVVDDEVRWEYKENDAEGTPVQGPFTSSEMAQRQADGNLAPKGVARRVNTSASFNPVARIDFDLYC
ncbi:unnamed protein product [Caenorhabditis auriculariae]|uniref:GYF domain-containing protein n=1 Tax=Caenorhabditis auriculariae TaxID=2777116 RepID=A0A8S1HIL1_9PELO|nr:unnamed protein product [Caenorhabditis auriculariae]